MFKSLRSNFKVLKDKDIFEKLKPRVFKISLFSKKYQPRNLIEEIQVHEELSKSKKSRVWLLVHNGFSFYW